MSQPIVVRKYENRRLYDTSSSRYVNLPEIAQLVREGAEVQVVDAKSGEDITRVILTQIIHEDARNKKGELPLPFLRELIVTSDRAFRDFLSWYADAALSAQRGAKEVFTPLAHALPFLERTLETLRQKAVPAAAGKAEGAPKTEDVEGLKARIAELEVQLAGRRSPRRKAPKAQAALRRTVRRPAR
ncbi:MAG: polyhydroxyalkanoate synthesis regulator DNA-binding domain-containing protein [Holophagales bacterium]|nr:polyhydroxyalkanoate synthesis regulator DNA-binding domain-containing protein [Holophagales bacterium]